MATKARVIAHTEAHAGPDGVPAYRFYVQMRDRDAWSTIGSAFAQRIAAVAYIAAQGWELTSSQAE